MAGASDVQIVASPHSYSAANCAMVSLGNLALLASIQCLGPAKLRPLGLPRTLHPPKPA